MATDNYATSGSSPSFTSASQPASRSSEDDPSKDAPDGSKIFVVPSTCSLADLEPKEPTVSISYFTLLRRHRFLTICYCMVFWCFGLGVAFLGPTLLDLGCRTASVFSRISWVFFSQALFILVGSASGGWIATKLPKHVVLLVSVLIMSGTLSIIPFCRSIYPLAVTLAFMGFFMGIIDTLAQISMIELYGKNVGPFLQALHFFYGFGAFLAPMVVKPWLLNFDCTPLIDPRQSASSESGHNDFILEHRDVTIVSLDEAIVASRVQHAFWIMALMQVPVLILLSIVVVREFLLVKRKSRTVEIEMSPGNDETRELPDDPDSENNTEGIKTVHHVILLTGLAALLLFMVDGLQAIYASYVYTFAIKMFDTVYSSEAAYLNASFWGSFALGRLCSIAISAFITPQIMLLGNVGGCLSGIVLLLVVPHSRVAIYVGTVAIGLFLSSVYPTILSLVKKYVHITPCITTTCVVSAAAGEMFMPVIVGHEFGSFGPESFVITCLILSSLAFLIYLILIFVGNCVDKNKTGETRGDAHWKRLTFWNRQSGAKCGLHVSRSTAQESLVSMCSPVQ